MSWKDIDKKVLADVIDGLGKEFTTWDVLADARVRAAHPTVTSTPSSAAPSASSMAASVSRP